MSATPIRAGILWVAMVLLASVSRTSALALDCGVPVAGDQISLELVVSGLSNPVDIAAPPGDVSRLFVVEQGGRIRVVDLDVGTVVGTFLDISARVSCCGERGLLGLAFHPDYEANGEFFVNYTRAPGGTCAAEPPPGCTSDRRAETIVSRFRVSDDPNLADEGSEEILLEICQPFSNHNAGQLAFSPLDGYLYVGTGDGGSANDPCNSGQRSDTLLGKMLRIDVDGADDGLAYRIPPDNPFLNDAGVRPEIWAFGLRNPWRYAFDAERGDLYIADVGQGDWEEVSIQPLTSTGGENYEWRRREGDHAFSSSTAYGPGVPTAPAYEYPHGGGEFRGCSITGGVVYRGCRMPDLKGRYFFADWCEDWVGSFRYEDGQVSDLRGHTSSFNAAIDGSLGRISTFGTDGRGEVYIADRNGLIYRIVPDTCSATRRLPPAYTEGSTDPITVAITARALSGPSVIEETIPVGWEVVDAGGAVLDGATLRFEVTVDGDFTYEVAPGANCASATFSGTLSGPSCEASIGGAATIECRPPSFVLIDEGSSVRYFRGRTNPHAQWREPDFDDADWSAGELGIGYGDGDDRTTLDDMRDDYVSVYCRMEFDLATHGLSAADVASLDLAVRVDDGCALYLNGDEVGRVNLDAGVVTSATTADATVGDATLECDVFAGPHDPSAGCAVLRLSRDQLRDGRNVLAASVHNGSVGSSDLTFIPTLIAAGHRSSGDTFFRRGDVDDSGQLQITDAVRVLLWLFGGGAGLPCLEAADVDNNGSVELTDPVRLLNALFSGGPPPAQPDPDCGPDDDEVLGCDSYLSC